MGAGQEGGRGVREREVGREGKREREGGREGKRERGMEGASEGGRVGG